MANNFDEYSLSTKFDPKPWALPFKLFTRYKKHTAIMLLSAVVLPVVEAIYPKFSEYAIAHFIGNNTLDGMGAFIALYLFLLMITVIFTIIYS